MCNPLLGTAQWAQMEFGSAQLGDARRSARLVEVSAAVATCPSGTLPASLPDWAGLKAAYRLLDNEAVTYERIITPHWLRTRDLCREPGEYLLVEDTTMLDFTLHPKTTGLGWLTRDQWSRGLLLHTTLALRVEAWDLEQCPEVSLVGLFGQQCWTREHERRKGKESRRASFERPRESQRWAGVFEQVQSPPAGVEWIYIADRESDIYEVFQRCQQRQIKHVIRASCQRALSEGDQTVFSRVAGAPLLGTMRLPLRTRADTAARTAELEVRSADVELRGTWRPGGKLPSLKLNVIEVREINAPAGQEPICWVLLTSLACTRLAEVQRAIACYARRWLVEEYHKALKTGTRIEASQLESRTRLEALLGILAVVAVRLLQTKLLARSRPDEIIQETAFGSEAIEILNARFGRPEKGWTQAALLIAIARLGGFLARKNDGPPGWITIWRGWRRLMTMAEGLSTVPFWPRTQKKCG
jgi:hypothetical protein